MMGRPSPFPLLNGAPADGFPARYSVAKRCAELGLRPIVGATAGRNFVPALKYRAGLPSDHVKFAARMVQEHPDAERLGLIMGPCRAGNVFGVDVDRGHANGADGFKELRAWLDAQGLEARALPRGPRWLTPRHGLQMIFRAPDGVTIRNMSGKGSLAPGVDVRGYNGLLTIPPTEREDGRYTWAGELSLFQVDIPEAPACLIAAVCERAAQTPAPASPIAFNPADSERRRNYVMRALDGAVSDLQLCGPGGRNLTLFQAAATVGAFAAGEPGLFELNSAVARLRAACVANGLMKDDGALAVDKTIASGLRRGRDSPRHVPPRTMQRPDGHPSAAGTLR